MSIIKLLQYVTLITIILLISTPICFAITITNSTIEYNEYGNIISESGYTYKYNDMQELDSIYYKGQLQAQYTYDMFGKRIKKIEYINGVPVTTYLIDDIYAYTNNNGTTSSIVYYYAHNTLVGENNNGTLLYYHSDYLGSPDVITNSSGAVVYKADYLPYGISLNKSSGLFGFTGQEQDNSELVYMGARYYSPITGRFLQADTMLPDIYDPQQLNRYSYARNNPLMYTDPSGHWFETALDIGFIGLDLKEIYHDPGNAWNWAALAGDLAGAALPFVTGVGRVIKGAEATTNLYRATNRVADTSRTIQRTLEGGSSAARQINRVADTTTITRKLDTQQSFFNKQGELVRYTNIDSLVPTQPGLKPQNYDEIYDSMKNIGFSTNSPVRYALSPTGQKLITNGHHRLAVAKALGYNKVPTVVEKSKFGRYIGDGIETPRTYSQLVSDGNKYSSEFWRNANEIR